MSRPSDLIIVADVYLGDAETALSVHSLPPEMEVHYHESIGLSRLL